MHRGRVARCAGCLGVNVPAHGIWGNLEPSMRTGNQYKVDEQGALDVNIPRAELLLASH